MQKKKKAGLSSKKISNDKSENKSITDLIPANIRTIVLMILCTGFTSLGQLFLKIGLKSSVFSFQGFNISFWFLLGCLFYGIGAIIFILALKGADLSIAYPLISMSFVWVALLSIFVIGESLIILQWIGIVTIIAGVYFIGRGAKK